LLATVVCASRKVWVHTLTAHWNGNGGPFGGLQPYQRPGSGSDRGGACSRFGLPLRSPLPCRTPSSRPRSGWSLAVAHALPQPEQRLPCHWCTSAGGRTGPILRLWPLSARQLVGQLVALAVVVTVHHHDATHVGGAFQPSISACSAFIDTEAPAAASLTSCWAWWSRGTVECSGSGW